MPRYDKVDNTCKLAKAEGLEWVILIVLVTRGMGATVSSANPKLSIRGRMLWDGWIIQPVARCCVTIWWALETLSQPKTWRTRIPRLFEPTSVDILQALFSILPLTILYGLLNGMF